MEALLLIFGELVFALLAPFVMLVVDLIGSVLSLFVSFGASKKTSSPGTGRVARLVAVALMAIAGLILSVLVVVNTFYFDNAVRYVFGMAEARSSVKTSCLKIDGSVFTGRIELEDCAIQRVAHPTSTFDLRLDQLTLDIEILSLFGTADIELAKVSGLAGWVTRNRTDSSISEGQPKVEKPKRSFVIDQLNVTHVRIGLSGINPDGNPFELPIEIQKLESQPLRSRLALFDILFRSNASGSIAGAPFQIATATIDDGRSTQWRAQSVPVASLGAMTGGALAWFSSGSVDLHVDDQWQLSDAVSIDMDWRLAFKDVQVSTPAGTGPVSRLAAEPLIRYVNGLKGEFPLNFQMVVNESQFEFKSSLAAAGLWSAFGESVNAVLAKFGVKLGSAAETASSIKEGAKSVLDRLRKPKTEDAD